MQSALVIAGLSLGLASGTHCIAMCGPGSACLAGRSPTGLAGYHAGRMLSYSILGAALAGAAAAFANFGSLGTSLRPLWAMLHTALALLGLTLLCRGEMPAMVSAFAARITQARQSKAFTSSPGAPAVAIIAFEPSRPAPLPALYAPGSAFGKGLTVGAAWALVPCGPLYSAGTLALLGGEPLTGAVTMASFALASGVQLAAAHLWWQRSRFSGTDYNGGHQRWQRLWMRIAGASLCASSLYAIGMLFMQPGQVPLLCQ